MPIGVMTNIVTAKPGQDFVLPAASTYTGQTVLVKNAHAANDLLVRTTGQDTIDSALTTYTLAGLGCLGVYSDGTTWWTIFFL